MNMSCLFFFFFGVCIFSWEKAMVPHSSTLAWKSQWREEPGRLQSTGRYELGMTERLHFHFSLSRTGEGNGNPLQCSCLENPRDRGAWWAAVYQVAQSHTWLKQRQQLQLNTVDSALLLKRLFFLHWINYLCTFWKISCSYTCDLIYVLLTYFAIFTFISHCL